MSARPGGIGPAGHDWPEEALLAAFDAATLPPDDFTHVRHLHVAWLYLRRHGFPLGAVRFVEALQRYVAAVGATGKYHETITWAYLVLINEERQLRGPPDETFEALLARRPELRSHRTGPLSGYYTAEELASDEARRVFLLPRRPAVAKVAGS